MSQSYRDLIAWQKAMALAEQVFAATENFPKREIFGLAAQLRRAAVSVPSNIAEGQSRHSRREFQHFLRTAKGSIAEIETQILLAAKFGYVTDADSRRILELCGEVSRILAGLIASMAERAAES